MTYAFLPRFNLFPRLTGILLLVTCVSLSFCTHAQVGKTLPADFKFFKLADSTAFTSSSLEKGKKSLIIFFDATCEHCQHEMVEIGKQADDFAKVHIYLITMDDKQQAEKFMSIYGKDLKDKKFVTVLLDPLRHFMPNFLPERFPAIYVYSESKQLTWHKDGQREISELLEAIK